MTAANVDSIYPLRQARLAAGVNAAGLDAVALNAGPSLTYLTGLNFHLSERPVLGIFAPGDPVILVLPMLEGAKVENLAYPLRALRYGEDPASWGETFLAGIKAARINRQKIGVEPRRMRVLELRLLEGAAPNIEITSAENILGELRMHKDEMEIADMRKAVDIAQQALHAALPLIRPGMTERELAAEITLQMLRHGSDSEMPFSPIAASGPNSANPHAFPGDRQLAKGDMLILDWGANVNGYFSDLTRTFVLGTVDPEMEAIARIVAEANAAAREAALPGVTAGEVDLTARQVIAAAGYGDYFIHRTGHGLGLETHEEPYIREGNPLQLDIGMTFTIEPGIYLPRRGGVRIEDNIVITSEGSESLSDMSRKLIDLI
jgi:Xaa-Pro dipeptidase